MIKAQTEGQEEYINIINSNKIIFVDGPAGSGKTFIPSVIALDLLLKDKYEKVIISRPVVLAGAELGFLPGNIDEKLEPYMRPIMDVFADTVNKKQLDELTKKKKIEVAPIEYLRGRTFNNSFVIFDEVQNMDYGQFVLALTRFGKGSKMVFTGDSSQCDLRDGAGAFLDVVDKLDGIDGIGIARLTPMDIVREPIIRKILERL